MNICLYCAATGDTELECYVPQRGALNFVQAPNLSSPSNPKSDLEKTVAFHEPYQQPYIVRV